MSNFESFPIPRRIVDINALNANVTAAAASATLADARADDAASFAGYRNYQDVATLLANTTLEYGAGAAQVAAGDVIRTRSEGFAYTVAASGASDQHVTTAGGVKLYVVAGADGYNLNAFGTVGDGVADDTTAVQAWLDAIPDSGVGIAPFGGYRFTAGLTRANAVRIIGEGAEFIPDIDAATDAMTIGPASGSQYNFVITGFQIVTPIGTSNRCRNGLVVRKAQQATIDVMVNAACAEYGLVCSGMVWADVRYRCGYTNTHFTGGGSAGPQNGLFIDFDGVNQANAGRYWFNIELCPGKGLYIEDQVTGGQTVYSGSIGYCGGNLLEVHRVQGASFDDIYFEHNIAYSIVLDQVNFCSMKNWKRGNNSANLTMTDCSHNTFVGGQHRGNTWTMDDDCVGNVIDNTDLQGGGFIGGRYTRWGAGVRNSNVANSPIFSPGGDDLVNYASNSNFEQFLSDRPGGGWNKPAAVTYTQTGVGKADTIRRVSRYAAKLSATGITSATFEPANKTQLIEHIKRTRFVSVKLEAYFPNTTENLASTAIFQLRTRVVSAAAGNTDYFSVVNKTRLDEWQTLYTGGIKIPGDVADIQFNLFIGDGAQNPTVLYVSDFSIVPTPTAVRDYLPEPGNAAGGMVTGGLLALVDGVTAPVTLAGHAQIYVDAADGDLKVRFGDGTTKTIATDT